ncbi:MAG: DNA double-strand break repair nuclease NurA [Crenarchaeota archaeon]|nr:DNA double-strand break repair nuclease NurA [Thermoproteota archaeon]
MLPQALDKALSSFGSLRSKVDEALVKDQLRRVKWMWLVYTPSASRRLRVAGIDSGYNFIEYRGYALYVVDAACVSIDSLEGGEEVFGDADTDVISSSFIESELAAYSIAMEIELARRALDSADLVVVDGSLVAKFATLARAAESGFEIERLKGISFRRVLDELIYLVGLYPSKIVFLAKNTSSKDVLGLVKGDVYYFDRYTAEVGFSKPVALEDCSSIGSRALGSRMRGEIKRLVGSSASVYVTYARLRDGARVYRLELVVEDGESPRERVKRVVEALSAVEVQGYPYPLLRADQLARVSERDVERVATVLGISRDPVAREILWAGYP